MSNPYVIKAASILGEILAWGKYLVAFVAAVIIAIYGLKYMQGDASEKKDAVTNIKQTFYIGGGIFFLVWFVQYIVQQFAGV